MTTCRGCGEPVAAVERGTVWCKTPLGLAALAVHRSQDCAKAALEASGWTMYPGNRPPTARSPIKLKSRDRHSEEAAGRIRAWTTKNFPPSAGAALHPGCRGRER